MVGLPSYLSLGAGLQSSVMALLAEAGEIKRPKAAIFADTQWEPPHVYETVALIESLVSYPVSTVTAGSLLDDQMRSYTTVPFFVAPRRMGRRGCTTNAKTKPVQREIKRLEGVTGRMTRPCEVMLGITVDEIHRVKPSPTKWERRTYPLLDLGLKRGDLGAIWGRLTGGLPVPAKSSCIGCPYHSSAHWRTLPDDQLEIVARDEERLQEVAVSLGRPPPYIHSSCRPIRTVVEEMRRQGSLGIDDGPVGEDCTGYCHT